MEDKKVYTIHCSICAKLLGISLEQIQKELHSPILYCMKCAKKEIQKDKDDKLNYKYGRTYVRKHSPDYQKVKEALKRLRQRN